MNKFKRTTIFANMQLTISLYLAGRTHNEYEIRKSIALPFPEFTDQELSELCENGYNKSVKVNKELLDEHTLSVRISK